MTLTDLAIKKGADDVYLENLLELVHNESNNPKAQADELKQFEIELTLSESPSDLPNPNLFLVF